MIISNERANDLQVVLFNLYNSKFHFHATGSRVFGGATLHSDHDFFAQYSKEILPALYNMGFSHYMYEEYTDKNTIEVYRHNIVPVDIQLQRNIEAKIKAQLVLLRLNAWIHMVDISKDQRSALWNQTYFALDYKKEDFIK